MSLPNRIKIKWEFDIAVNEELQNRLNLTEGMIYEMLEDEDEEIRLHRLCCGETGTPEWVDLDLFFDDPRSISEDEITETLSDDYGWLIKSWEWQYV